jgi:uncharacterized protein (TIGR02186 family)
MRALAAVLMVCALGPLGGATPAAAEKLVFAVSNHRVQINSSFTGADLVLFGAVEPNGAPRERPSYDIVVTVTGPRQDVVTRRKERVVGIWVNAASRTFAEAPTYLAVLSNRDLDLIAGLETRRRLQLGLSNIVLSSDNGSVNDDPFRAALIRLNVDHGLYREDPKAATFLTPNLFRAGIKLPANSPIGTYRVEVRLFQDGQFVTSQESAFEIVKVGFESVVATEARERGLLYGLVTVGLAILTGWLAAVVFRRD